MDPSVNPVDRMGHHSEDGVMRDKSVYFHIAHYLTALPQDSITEYNRLS